MKKKITYVVIFIALVALSVLIVRYFWDRNPLIVDVSDINLEVEIMRFDIDLQDVLIGNSYQKIEALDNKYYDFFDIYNFEIIGIGSIENASYLTYLTTFLNDYAVVEANKEVKKTFNDCSQLNNELTDGFKHLVYYYPNVYVPSIVGFVAGFNHSIVVTENFFGIGFDKYLGKDCELYNMLDIPEYAKSEMSPEQIPIDVMIAWAESEYPFESKDDYLIDHIIYKGRLLYFLDAIFPKMEEHRKNKYTLTQLDFCYIYERDMWTNFIENKLLFTTDLFTIRKFTESAPFTAQFGPESPPRVANWIGLQIVRSYMKSNKDVDLPQLMAETDYQKILNKSNYNPKFR